MGEAKAFTFLEALSYGCDALESERARQTTILGGAKLKAAHDALWALLALNASANGQQLLHAIDLAIAAAEASGSPIVVRGLKATQVQVERIIERRIE